MNAPRRRVQTQMVMAMSTALSRITGFGRIFALAYALGFTRLTDTYNLANTTPNIVFDLVLGGVLAGTLVPVFVDWLATAEDEDASHAIAAVATVSIAVAAALSALLMLTAPLVVRAYTIGLAGSAADGQRALAAGLLRLFAPQVFLYGVITVLAAALNARRRFVAPMITPVLNNLVVIGVFLAVPHVARGLSVPAIRADKAAFVLLGLGTTAGVALQAVALLPALRRAHIRLRFTWDPRHPAVRRVLRLSGWAAGYVATNHVALWLVLVLANRRPGDVSAYQAAFMFFQLPIGVIVVTVLTVLQPELAESWSRRDAAKFVDTLSVGIRRIAFLLVPAALCYVLFGRTLLTLVLRHGALAAHSAQTTGDVLVLFALALPAFGVFLFVMSAFQAMQNTRTAFGIYCIENLANVVFALLVYPVAGVQGLALSFGAAYLCGATCAVVAIGRRIERKLGLGLNLVRIGAAATIAAVAGRTITVVMTSTWPVGAALASAAGAAVLVVAYIAVAARVGAPDAVALVAAARRRAGPTLTS